MLDESAEAIEVDDICVECGTGIRKPASVQIGPVVLIQRESLCPPCAERHRWRQQICVEKPPFQKPLWRPKRKDRPEEHSS